MTYNIRHGADAGLDMRILAEDILRNTPDVVGIQEIDEETSRVGGMRTLEELSRATGYSYVSFAKAMDYRGGAYGTGILSRYPIREAETVALYSESEPRVLGYALLDVEGEPLHFFNTHLEYVSEQVRRKELEEVALRLSSCERFVLTGDFNTSNLSEFEVLPRCQTVNDGRYGSFYATGDAIDHIFYSDDFTLKASAMDPVTHSDHCLIWADLEVR